MNADTEKDDLEKLVDECVSRLAEHCDSVRIFATRPSDDGSGSTGYITRGSGNYFAQAGVIREWITVQDERTRQVVREERSNE